MTEGASQPRRSADDYVAIWGRAETIDEQISAISTECMEHSTMDCEDWQEEE